MTSPKSRPPLTRQRSKPAFVTVLAGAEGRMPGPRTLLQMCGSTYHAYARWITRISRRASACMKMAEVPTSEEVTQQAKVLVQEYIYQRLKKQNLLTMKAELRGATAKHSDASLEIQLIGAELEKMYPDLYSSVSTQVNVTMSTDVIVRKTFATVAEQLFKTSVTWGKVVALFSLAGAFAVDCVSQGHPNFVTAVVDSFTEAVSDHLVTWIIRQGGWTDVIRAFRTSKEAQVVWALSACGAVLGLFLTLGATMHL